MVQTVNYLHNKAQVAHLDLSLENFTIEINSKQEMIIRLIDFGVAHECTMKMKNS